MIIIYFKCIKINKIVYKVYQIIPYFINVLIYVFYFNRRRRGYVRIFF